MVSRVRCPAFVRDMVGSILLVDGVCVGWRGLGMGVLGFIGRLGLWLLWTLHLVLSITSART
jgi:hypothetical protein